MHIVFKRSRNCTLLHIFLFHLFQEYKYYNVPPYSDNFNKDAMIRFFEKQYATQQDDYEPCEMDVDASENASDGKIMLENPQVSNIGMICINNFIFL